VDTHFQTILEDLKTNLVASQWRLREASALALSDLLRGRQWEDLGPHLTELWLTIFKVMDDIKESVRTAALQASKRLHKASVQMCKHATSGAAAVAVVLPVVLDHGLLSQVADVKSVSLGLLVEVSKEAGTALKPHAARLVTTLLEALSGTESGQLNYLVNLLNDDHTANVADDIRASMQSSSPLSACLDDCLSLVDGTILPELVPRLLDLLKHGLGASTQTGCARAITTLVRHCREELRPYALKLLKALVGSAATKSAPVQREFAKAFAAVSRVGAAVRFCPVPRPRTRPALALSGCSG
jgi:proteasome component ECM29